MKTNIKIVSLILGVMCFLLTFGIYTQVKTVNNSGTAVAKTNEENELRDKVLEMKQHYEENYKNLEKREKELNSLIEEASKDDGNATQISENIDKLNSILGFTTLEGPGIKITVSDGEPSENAWNVSNYIVHDEDLLQIVNELFNGGAEAVSINGVRIIGSTAITCIGNVIKINNEKVGNPFVIKAIGSKRLSGTLNRVGGYLEYLSSYGVKVEVEEMDKLTIEKYNGVYEFKYAN